MTRSMLIIGAAVVIGLGLAGGLALIATKNNGQSDRGMAAANRSSTEERRPEAESGSVGELPAVEHAARRFLAGYLPLIYGQRGASIDGLASASPRLIARLKAEGGHVTPAQAERTPRLQRVAVIEEGTIGALATAHIKDSPSPVYPLVFHLQKTPEGWVVTRIGGP